MPLKIVDAIDMTDRQGRKLQSLHVVATDLSEKFGQLVRDEQLKVLREDGTQAALVRFYGFGHVRYMRMPENPPMVLCVASDTNVQSLVGCTLVRML